MNKIQPNVVAIFEGRDWLLHGYNIFKKQPLVWILTLLAYWTAMFLFGLIPIVGLIVSLVISPGIAFGFICLAKAVDQNIAGSHNSLTEEARFFSNGRAVATLSVRVRILNASRLSEKLRYPNWGTIRTDRIASEITPGLRATTDVTAAILISINTSGSCEAIRAPTSMTGF